MGDHDLTGGIEARYWKARHAGEILNTFDNDLISYYIGNVKNKFKEADLYYDYDGIKPQNTAFGHALWRFMSGFRVVITIQGFLRSQILMEKTLRKGQ